MLFATPCCDSVVCLRCAEGRRALGLQVDCRLCTASVPAGAIRRYDPTLCIEARVRTELRRDAALCAQRTAWLCLHMDRTDSADGPANVARALVHQNTLPFGSCEREESVRMYNDYLERVEERVAEELTLDAFIEKSRKSLFRKRIRATPVVPPTPNPACSATTSGPSLHAPG